MLPMPGSAAWRERGRQNMTDQMRDQMRDQWDSQWNQQDAQTRGGAPTAYPDFTERGAPSDMDMDEGGAEDVGDEIDAIEENGAKNKIWIYAGLGLAGIAGVYFLTKKKTPTKRSRTGTKAR